MYIHFKTKIQMLSFENFDNSKVFSASWICYYVESCFLLFHLPPTMTP